MWYLVQRFVALLLLFLLTPLFAILWIAVKATSKGPFLYVQIRPGYQGRAMPTWKIRTMRPGADRNTEFARGVTACNPEVTEIGRILRKLKLDELPQLWNITKGEMAFVGPRPIAFSLYDELKMQIPCFDERHWVRPGLTNVGQVSIEDNASSNHLLDDWQERFEAERHYIRNRSVAYDLVVITLTLLYIGRNLLGMILLARARAARLLVPKVGIRVFRFHRA